MLAETAALRLGTTVAKAAAQSWLGGKRRKQERHSSMEELVRVRVSGVRLQREVRQQFEQITNAVFDRLESYLKHEFQRLDEGGRRAVVDAVADTFMQADLSDEALLAADLHAAELIRRITRSVAPPTGLNEAETRLYNVLFTECVEYYVRVVQSLPVFEERATAELLARFSTLGADVARILEKLPDRSLFAPDGTDRDASFRHTYLELVSRDLDRVELFRRASDGTTARARLSVAYVSLRTTGADATRQRRATWSKPTLRSDMRDWEEGKTESSSTRIEATLGGASKVLLRGEAGSGKTTLLRWLAITSARGAFTGELTDWNGLTPIFIKLREYSGRPLPNPEAMLDGAAGPITGIMPKGWVHRELRDGNTLMLIDGVDELLDRERRTVRDWLRTLLGQYTRIRVVVTSRPAAASADWLHQEDFTALHLDRMTPPDLASFVRQWHYAVRELGDELPCAVEDLPRYEQSLLNSLKDRPHLQSLAGTPLLASMLCAMHLNRGSQLPRDRMELYRNALQTLVHDRDADRSVPSASGSRLTLRDKLVLLRDLAWRLSDNNRSEISLVQAAVHIDRKLAAMRHLDEQDGEHVLKLLRLRSGVLRTPAEGRLDFVHRTFQEYLAAEDAAEEDRMGNLIERAHLDMWRETIIMTAGHANTRQREELLHGVLDRAAAEPRNARALRLLAASCQETLPEVSESLARRLDASVEALLPARRRTDPPALAAVGTSLLRKLPRSLDECTAKVAVQTVRTVALIGGEEALAVMAGYSADRRGLVVAELIDSWGYFDADAYADQVLSTLPLADHLVTLTHSAQWKAAARLPSLTRLSITYPFSDFAPLEGLPPLEGLEAQRVLGGTDLSPLAAHPHLSDLRLVLEGPVQRLDTVGDLESLSDLALDIRHAPVLDGLRLGPAVCFFSLHRVTQDTDLTVLSGHPTIEFVYLSGRKPCLPQSFEILATLPRLDFLSLTRIDVDAWLRTSKPIPLKRGTLSLRDCVLPEDHSLLTVPGTQLRIHA
jgi:hypothetical protein